MTGINKYTPDRYVTIISLSEPWYKRKARSWKEEWTTNKNFTHKSASKYYGDNGWGADTRIRNTETVCEQKICHGIKTVQSDFTCDNYTRRLIL